MNNKFAENLKKIRKDHNLSQEQLADELGVSRQAISKWESAQAYPEMDKIITLCNKFNLNIDDLLHKDITEVKKEEEGKKTINSYVDNFLNFITNSINMFIKMSTKDKFKLIVEEMLILFALVIAFFCLKEVIMSVVYSILNLFPLKLRTFFYHIGEAIIGLASFLAIIAIMVHVYKKRYLDYYEDYKASNEVKEEKIEEKVEPSNDNIKFNKKEEKIIIRDEEHSGYHFGNLLYKIVLYSFKFFLLWFGFAAAVGVVGLSVAFVLSFLIINIPTLFSGMILSIGSLILLGVIFLTVVLNFVFSRKTNHKFVILGIILSLIALGCGTGLFITGILSLDVVKDEETYNSVVTTEHDMSDKLTILPYFDYQIEYVEENIPNVKIEYHKNDNFIVRESTNDDIISFYINCENPFKVANDFLKNLKYKNQVTLYDGLGLVKVYASSDNIKKLKANRDDYYTSYSRYERTISYYENKIDNLEEELYELRSNSVVECED